VAAVVKAATERDRAVRRATRQATQRLDQIHRQRQKRSA
jgi:hypothetical protein